MASNNAVEALYGDIEAAVRAADEADKAGDASRAVKHAKVYDALTLALTLARTAELSEDGNAQLEALYARHGIKKARKDANPFTRLVKLCFPNRRSVDYNRYAGALAFAEGLELGEETFRAELDEDGGLTRMADAAKYAIGCATPDSARQKLEEARVKAFNNALADFEKIAPLVNVPWERKDGPFLVVGLPLDNENSMDLHILEGDHMEYLMRVCRKLAKQKGRT